jgi:hypothetical protein
MAVCERRNDRPAALARSEAEDGGPSDLVVSRGMTAQPSGEEDRERAIAGPRSASHASALRRPIRQQKGPHGRGHKQPSRENIGEGTRHRRRRRHRSSSATRAQQKAIPRSRSNGEGSSCSCDRCNRAAAPEPTEGVSLRQDAARPHVGDRDASSSKEAINASGALNRPRRSSGGMTASTASSFSEASIRR